MLSHALKKAWPPAMTVTAATALPASKRHAQITMRSRLVGGMDIVQRGTRVPRQINHIQWDNFDVHERGVEFSDQPGREPFMPYRIAFYFTRNNTHAHLSYMVYKKRGPGEISSMMASYLPTLHTALNISAGQVGFKGASRNSEEAAIEVTRAVIAKLNGIFDDSARATSDPAKPPLPRIKYIDIALSGFGANRNAVISTLNSQEGDLVRSLVYSVSDITRVSDGGTRPKKRRKV